MTPLLTQLELECTGTHGHHGLNRNMAMDPGDEPLQCHQRKMQEEVLSKVPEDPRGNTKTVHREAVDQHDGRDVRLSIILCLLGQHGGGRMDCVNRWWSSVIGHGHGGIDGCIIWINSCTNVLLLGVLEESSGPGCTGCGAGCSSGWIGIS